MRVVFMGSPEFAVPTLLEMSRNAHVPVAAYTRPPARSGPRGLEVRRTPVHSAADSLGIPVFTPSSLRDVEVQKAFNSLAADVIVVDAYGPMIPTTTPPTPRP